MSPHTAHLVGSLTPVLVIALILAFRLPGMLKRRRDAARDESRRKFGEP